MDLSLPNKSRIITGQDYVSDGEKVAAIDDRLMSDERIN